MSSYLMGKEMIRDIIRRDLPKGSTALDVGACDGAYFELLHDHLIMDAVEVWAPNVEQYNLTGRYREVFVKNIKDVSYDYYDLVIFGDVIEHMTVEDAQSVLEYAKQHSREIIVAVPYQYKQGALYGNPFERHIQDDLTEDVFLERYKGFTVSIPYFNYGYFVWRKKCDPD